MVQQPVYDNWLDAPQTPGDWSYRDRGSVTLAVFTEAGGGESFALVCRNKGGGEMLLSRAGVAGQPVPMQIITETGRQLFNAEPSDSQTLDVRLRSRNPLLDAMALSRGRFAVETAGLKTLYLPSWAEVTRVIEDCR